LKNSEIVATYAKAFVSSSFEQKKAAVSSVRPQKATSHDTTVAVILRKLWRAKSVLNIDTVIARKISPPRKKYRLNIYTFQREKIPDGK